MFRKKRTKKKEVAKALKFQKEKFSLYFWAT